MELVFSGAKDFIAKRAVILKRLDNLGRKLANQFKTVENIESLDAGVNEITYLTLKELRDQNPHFLKGQDHSHNYTKVQLRYKDGIFQLEIRANGKNLEPHLNLFSDLYDFLPEGKQAWLLGSEDTEERRVRDSDDLPLAHPYDTKKLVQEGNFTNLAFVPLKDSPRDGWDSRYSTFSSREGFNSVRDFCSKYPLGFNQAIIVLSGARNTDLEIDTWRSSGSRDLLFYSSNITLSDNNLSLLERVANSTDKYFVNH